MIKVTSILLTFFIVTGCSDQLEADIQGIYTDASFYKTEQHALFAINATYEITAFKTADNSLWVFGDIASDDALKGGNAGDQSEITSIDDFTLNRDNGFILSVWKHYFEGVTRANKVLYYVPLIEMNEELKNQIIGEAYFLRAYFYFHLVNIFGEVPLKSLPAFSVDDLHIPKSPISDIYEQIEDDLIEASNLLPDNYSGNEVGRATKGAALGLYAKALLFQEKWTEVLVVISQIKTLGYSLLPVYSQNFQLDFENNSESIFEIQHLSGQAPSLGSNLHQWFSPSTTNGYFFNAPTQDFVDEFETTLADIPDPRLDYTVGREGQKWVNDEDFDPIWSEATGYLQKKHVQPLSEVGTTTGDGGLNYTFMRYAEIILMEAEALNESNQSALALTPLNEIRTRARESYLFDDNLPGFGAIPTDLLPNIIATDQNTIRNAIQHERRVELGFEFHRYYDLMRYGAAVAEPALSQTNFTYAEHRYFPIPQSEIDTNNSISN